MSRFGGWLVAPLLGLTLVAPGLTGNLTPYLIDVVGLVLLVLVTVRGQLVPAFGQKLALIFLGAWLVLALCFAITAQHVRDLAFLGNFVPLLLAGPMAWILAGKADPGNGRRVATLALIGAGAAAAVALINIGLGYERSQGPLFPPITISNTAVILGFVAVAGTWLARSRWRWLYLAGPLLGIATVLVTGSRGPLLGVLPLAAVALVFLSRSGVVGRRAAVAAVLVLTAAIACLALASGNRVLSMVSVLADMLAGRSVGDFNAAIRLALYGAGYHAFLDAPLVGHGWARLMTAVMPYLRPDQIGFVRTLPQLHNDIVNFAVAAGLVGIAAYVAILVAPLMAALRSPADSQRSLRVYAGIVIAVAYFCAGLTDIMVGFEFHTTFLAALAAIVIGYCRDAPFSAASRPAGGADPSGRP